jgi:hypothetical protein
MRHIKPLHNFIEEQIKWVRVAQWQCLPSVYDTLNDREGEKKEAVGLGGGKQNQCATPKVPNTSSLGHIVFWSFPYKLILSSF